jgi:hypothetical protein
MNSIEVTGPGRRRLTAAACLMMAVLLAPSFGQQEGAPKPLLDSPLSPLLLTVDTTKFTGDARRTFDVLTLIVADADKAATGGERSGYLQEFLTRSQDFARAHPLSLPVWTLRAVAALEVNQATAGREACRHMMALRAGEMDDPRTRRVLAVLDRKGWFQADVPGGTGVDAAPTQPAPEQAPARPALVDENNPGANNVSLGEHSAKWGNYGAYLHSVMEAVQGEWARTLNDGKVKPPSGSIVTVRFSMDWKGSVTEVLDVQSTSSEPGRQSCVTALTMAAPFGEWTDNMKANLGISQELTFKFTYE